MTIGKEIDVHKVKVVVTREACDDVGEMKQQVLIGMSAECWEPVLDIS